MEKVRRLGLGPYGTGLWAADGGLWVADPVEARARREERERESEREAPAVRRWPAPSGRRPGESRGCQAGVLAGPSHCQELTTIRLAAGDWPAVHPTKA